MEVRFLTNEAGEDEGLNHPGIEHYMGAPYAAVARECGQNSRDARTDDPIRIKFQCLDIPVSSIPGFDQLSATIDQCYIEALGAKERGEKPRKFFENARTVAGAPAVKILEISDSNTTGLLVTASGTSAFDALVKGTGVSAVKPDDSGGSFGIGKFAAFAASELRTVFYSTAYSSPNTGANSFRFQGKSILTSHTDPVGRSKRATGYWGEPNFLPIADPLKCPAWARRTDRGTSVFCVGFRTGPDWQAQLAASVVQNFFLAIQRGQMVFEIEGFPLLNTSTLGAFFQHTRIVAAALSIGREEDLQLAGLLHRCVTDSATTVETIHMGTGGKVALRILIEDTLPKVVTLMRNGMMITDNLAHFGEKFRRFPRSRDFIAVIEPADLEASKQFKSMENPSHDELTTERIPNTTERAQLHAAMVKLSRDVRAAIRSRTTAPSQAQVDITELNDFFGGIDSGDQAGENRLDDPETQTVIGEITSMEPQSPGIGSGVGFGGGARKGKKARKRARYVKTGGKIGGGQEFLLSDPRNHLIDGQASRRRVYFTPAISGTAVLQIEALGMTDGKDPLRLPVSACTGDGCLAKNGNIELSLNAGHRVALDITFDEAYEGPIIINGSAIAETKQ